MDDHNKLLNELKDLNDIEFETLFVDVINKKLHQLVYKEIRVSTLLFMIMSISDTIKKYLQLINESNRTIPHNEIIMLLLNKSDKFLQAVANNEDQANYAAKTINELYDISKNLLLKIKSELINMPKYTYLKPDVLE